jgi:hypothetical protein
MGDHRFLMITWQQLDTNIEPALTPVVTVFGCDGLTFTVNHLRATVTTGIA